jgi:hypothetical protein
VTQIEKVMNLGSGLSLDFHVTSWCVTSVIRYVYIEHDEWIHGRVPDVRRQGYILQNSISAQKCFQTN